MEERSRESEMTVLIHGASEPMSKRSRLLCEKTKSLLAYDIKAGSLLSVAKCIHNIYRHRLCILDIHAYLNIINACLDIYYAFS